MSTAGIIFANLHDSYIPELTRQRSMGSIPFMCRYRLIDFALSNMVNSKIFNIGVIAHYNYYSLMDHIGTGKDWDLARRTGGVQILPPNVTAYAYNHELTYNTRLEALKNNIYNIDRMEDDLVLMCECDSIVNIDLRDIISRHTASGADMTIVTRRVPVTPQNAKRHIIFDSNRDGRITDIYINPTDITGNKDVSMNIIVIGRKLLGTLVHDAMTHNYTSFNRDIIGRNISNKNIMLYRWDGYYADILSFEDYFAVSMDIVSDPSHRDSLFSVKNRPIFTKVRNSPPTFYGDASEVRNSLIADGCKIEGTVENSILFRGVTVGRGAVVKNSILFQGAQVMDSAQLNCVVSDKNAVVRSRDVLSGCEIEPYYIPKGKLV